MIRFRPFSAIKGFFLVLFDLVKCIFKGTSRKAYHDSCSEALTSVSVQSPRRDEEGGQCGWSQEGSNKKSSYVTYQIELYRKEKGALRNPPLTEEIDHIDYFQDMTPKLTGQRKVIVKNKVDHIVNTEHSKTNFNYDATLARGDELGEWEDTECSQWDIVESDYAEISELVKEQRRQEREKRAEQIARKKMEKDRTRTQFATKIF